MGGARVIQASGLGALVCVCVCVGGGEERACAIATMLYWRVPHTTTILDMTCAPILQEFMDELVASKGRFDKKCAQNRLPRCVAAAV